MAAYNTFMILTYSSYPTLTATWTLSPCASAPWTYLDEMSTLGGAERATATTTLWRHFEGDAQFPTSDLENRFDPILLPDTLGNRGV